MDEGPDQKKIKHSPREDIEIPNFGLEHYKNLYESTFEKLKEMERLNKVECDEVELWIKRYASIWLIKKDKCKELEEMVKMYEDECEKVKWWMDRWKFEHTELEKMKEKERLSETQSWKCYSCGKQNIYEKWAGQEDQ